MAALSHKKPEGKMVIDIHTHVYPEKIIERTMAKLSSVSGITPCTNGMKSGLMDSMKKAGIAYSVIQPVATSPKQVKRLNWEAVEINQTTRETGLVSFGAIHPDTEDYAEVLTAMKQDGISGIKLHPDYQNAFFNDIRYKRIVEKATDLGLYIMVHGGVDIGLPEPVHCTPAMVDEMMRDTHTGNLIIAHMGGWRLWDEVEELLVGKNLYFDTSFSLACMDEVEGMLSRERFTQIVRDHGADKIVFGTDSPWGDQSVFKNWVLGCGLTEEELSYVMFENSCHILGETRENLS